MLGWPGIMIYFPNYNSVVEKLTLGFISTSDQFWVLQYDLRDRTSDLICTTFYCTFQPWDYFKKCVMLFSCICESAIFFSFCLFCWKRPSCTPSPSLVWFKDKDSSVLSMCLFYPSKVQVTWSRHSSAGVWNKDGNVIVAQTLLLLSFRQEEHYCDDDGLFL